MVFIVRASIWVSTKNAGFTHKKQEKTLLPLAFWMHGAHNKCP